MLDLQAIERATSDLILAIGDIRPQLENTPGRVAGAYAELLDGYSVDIDELFVVEEDEGKDQLVIVRNIEFTSLCQHHLLPFSGKANVGYLPKDKVIGISKLARLTLAYAHRLQLQERLTKQIVSTLMEKLDPLGAAAVIIGKHSCMRCRGVKSSQADVVTSEMLGQFRTQPTLRYEFLSLIGLE